MSKDERTTTATPTLDDIKELETAIKNLEVAVDELGGVEAFKQLMATPSTDEESEQARQTVAELFGNIAIDSNTTTSIRAAYLEQKVAMEEAEREFKRLIKKNQPPRELGRQLKRQFVLELEPVNQLVNRLGGMVARLDRLDKLGKK